MKTEFTLDLSQVETGELARAALMCGGMARAYPGRRRPPFNRLMAAVSRALLSELRGRALFGAPSTSATVKLPPMTEAERVGALHEFRSIAWRGARTGTTARSIFKTIARALAEAELAPAG